MDKKQSRLHRARKVRIKIRELKMARLTVFRSNCHIYAQVFAGDQVRVLAAASTLESQLRQNGGSTIAAAKEVGKLIAERAQAKGITQVAFDRAGFKFHGRVKALAEAAREGGLKF